MVWYDFSDVERKGEYVLLDVLRHLRSPTFRIAADVYDEVLKAAVRTFLYQRAGGAKEAKQVGEAWADGASHVGPQQDGEARSWAVPNDTALERDLRGGWYDAGDYNIPESGNGIPDLLDEVRFGLDYLQRLQNEDGSVVSIVDLGSASPPSSATEWSVYGPASTSATLSAAAAFAHAATVFSDVDGLSEDAAGLQQRAVQAYAWADANPSVVYFNRAADGTTRDGDANAVGAGEQEVDDRGRLIKKLTGAVYLFELTQEPAYKTFFDTNYLAAEFELLAGGFVQPFRFESQELLLRYAGLEGATAAIPASLREAYNDAMEAPDQLGLLRSKQDAYRAHTEAYVWGSNATKAAQGLMFAQCFLVGGSNPSYSLDACCPGDYFSVETNARCDLLRRVLQYLRLDACSQSKRRAKLAR